MSDTDLSKTKKISDIPSDQLTHLINDICESESLGRSKTYAKLLRYLVDASISGHSPKEIEIAVSVLDRDSDFDVSKDSAVRVYLHQLRKRLDGYYKKHPTEDGFRIVIPKGQYNVVLESTELTSTSLPDQQTISSKYSKKILLWAMMFSSVLLLANISYWFWRDNFSDKNLLKNPNQSLRDHPIWNPILADDIPILVVIGDYYIFGELDKAGNVKRMIREFSVNSKEDLETLFTEKPELAWQYNDLDLSYMPEGAAFALNSILPVVHGGGKKTVSIKMMSALTIQDLQSSHIIYLGYISGLGRLNRVVFSASNLMVGENYDELVNKENGKHFVSDAGLPSENRPFVDYGLISSVPMTSSTRLFVIAGMRDAGLMQVAESVVSLDSLKQLELTLSDDNGSSAFEVLYEVRGMDRANFSSRSIFEHKINSSMIWGTENIQ